MSINPRQIIDSKQDRIDEITTRGSDQVVNSAESRRINANQCKTMQDKTIHFLYLADVGS